MASNPLDNIFNGYNKQVADGSLIGDWRQYFETLGTFIWIWDLGTDAVEFTPAWLTLMGYRAHEIPTGTEWFSLVHPEDIDIVQANTQACLNGDKDQFDYEFRLRRADGLYQWLHSRARIVQPEILTENPQRYFVGVYTDTSIRHADRHKIHTLEQRWNAALTGTKIGVWEWDIKTGETFFSDEWCRMVDLDPNEVTPTIELWRELAYPEDLEKSDKGIAAYLAGDSSRYEFECRVRTKSGKLKWILDRGVIVETDPDGSPRKMIGTHEDISDRKAQELEILHTNDRIKRVGDAVPGFFYEYRLYPDGHHCFPFASGSIREVYGVTPEDVQKDASGIFEKIHPEDAKAVYASVKASAETGSQWRATYRVVSNNEVRWMQGVANRTDNFSDDGAVVWHGYLNDVTEIKRQETAHEEQNKLLQQITETVPGLLFTYVIHPDGTLSVPFIGKEVEQIFGISKSAAVTEPNQLWTYIHPDDKPLIISKVNSKEDMDLTFRILLPKVGERWRHVHAKCLTGQDGSATYYSYIMDVTERKEQELAVTDQAQALALANEDLEQFNYVAAHDLKEPLRAIRNLSEWIAEDLPEEALAIVEHNIQRMRERVDKLHLLVGDLATYSRAGRQDPEQIRRTNTRKVFDQAIESLDDFHANIEFDMSENIEFETIEVALVTVLKNLITNALKHHDRCAPIAVRVGVTQTKGFLYWSVEDNGAGIAPEHHERIFKMYQRLNPENGPSGSGSGLAIVRRIVNTAHGKIGISSPTAEGRGTRFDFSWPLTWPKPPS